MAREAIPPPYFITADDKRGLIVVITAVVLAFVWTCSLIRIGLRWTSRDWRGDDYLLAAATVSTDVFSQGVTSALTELCSYCTLLNQALFSI
jgi:hypothetical protein